MIKYIVLAIVMLALATVFFFQKSNIREIHQKMPIWTPIIPSDVATIKITVATHETIELHQTAGTWQLNHQGDADDKAVEQLLQDLSDMRPMRVVTRKDTHDKKLRLDEQGIHVLLLDAGDHTILDAMVGKQGANLVSTYLRLQGSDVVLAMDKSLGWQLHRSMNDWKKMVEAPVNPVKQPQTSHP